MLTDLGQFIETHRKIKNMTQTDLVSLVGLEQSNYSAMIHGHRPISDELLTKLIAFLDIPESAISKLRENRNDKKAVIGLVRKLSPVSIRKLREFAEMLDLSEKHIQ